MSTQEQTRTFDLDALGWDDPKAFVHEAFPTAKHEGMGYWRIPRVAHIFYGIGRVKVEMMHGHDFTELATGLVAECAGCNAEPGEPCRPGCLSEPEATR